METKVYYPRLDILKFVCCIGVVTIHTRPFVNWPQTETYWNNLAGLCVPLFFIASSFLLWHKVNTRKTEAWTLLRKFASRLAILYFAWTLLMMPEWLSGYMKHNPDMLWLKLLPIKILLGAPHGSWFVTSLVYGTLICYYLNKLLPVWLSTIIASLLFFVPELLDFYGCQSSYGLLNLYNSPFKAFLPLQIGYLSSCGYLDRTIFACGGGKLLILCILQIFIPYFSSVAGYALTVCCWIAITQYCISIQSPDAINPLFLTMRKMSIIIYFTHFFFATAARALHERGYIGFEYGLPVFFSAVCSCLILAYAIVHFSKRFKLLTYLY